MKKAISLVLTAALVGTLCTPALAAEAADARLSAVTQAVKETLDLDTDGYDSFYGELSENELAPTWALSWSGPEGDLNVTASESGKILSYYRLNDGEGQTGGEDFAFPAVTEAEGQKAAQAFLDKVLDKDLETARFADHGGAANLSTTRYYFNGTVDLNGLPSPLSFSVTVRVGDGAVTRFSREDLAGRYIGGVPDSKPASTQADGAALLGGTKTLRLEYVLLEDGETAVLRYLPNVIDEYYVDAMTGELVNLSARYEDMVSGMWGEGSVKEMAADAAGRNQLTEAELQGAAKLAGALDKAALDKKAQAITELGLSKYTLVRTDYIVERLDEETPAADAKVTARLTYARQDGEDTWSRWVSLDAKTGDLISVTSSAPRKEDGKLTVTGQQAQEKAEAFLNAYYKEQFSQCALYELTGDVRWTAENRENNFIFAQQVNGYFYAGNHLDVSIDGTDGTVSSFSRGFDEGVTFESAQGLISMEAAQAAYTALFDTVLRYMAVPQTVDLAGSDIRPLLESQGQDYFYSLKLAYASESNTESRVAGIDAKTGTPILVEAGSEAGITYSDLEGHWVKAAAEALAEYGVGWTGGAMEPGKALTQLDLVALLVSVQRGAMADTDADDLYRTAYGMGILTKADREDGKIMTRLDIIRLLLDGTGYGKAAKLQGIYQCNGFADADTIADSDLGYAAIAQALGIVSGDSNGNFAAYREATRAEAAGMLYHFMSR